MSNDSYFKKYFKNIFQLFSGNFLAQLIGFLAMPAITRIYSPEIFGEYNLILQIAIFLGILISMRIEQIIPLSGNSKSASKVFYLFLGISLRNSLIIALIFFLLFIISKYFFLLSNFSLIKYFLIFLISLLILISNGFQGLIQTSQKYLLSSVSEVFLKSTFFILALIFSLIQSLQSIGLILAHALSLGAKILFINLYDKSSRQIFSRHLYLEVYHNFINTKLKERYLPLSNSIALSHIMLSFTTLVPLFFVEISYSQEDLGFYSLALNTIFLPTYMISLAVGNVYFERASKLEKKNLPIFDLWKKNFFLLVCLSIPFFTILSLFSTSIYSVIFGKDWVLSGVIAGWMSLPAMFSFISSPMDRTCVVKKNRFWGPFWHLLRGIMTILLCFYAYLANLELISFVIILSIGMSFLYILDLVVQLLFALNFFKNSYG